MIMLEWVFVKKQKKYAQNKLFILVKEFLKNIDLILLILVLQIV